TRPSAPPVSSVSPSCVKATLKTAASWAVHVNGGRLSTMFHNAASSSRPTAIASPLGLKQRECPHDSDHWKELSRRQDNQFPGSRTTCTSATAGRAKSTANRLPSSVKATALA